MQDTIFVPSYPLKKSFTRHSMIRFFCKIKTIGIKRHENTKSIIAMPYTLPVHSVA